MKEEDLYIVSTDQLRTVEKQSINAGQNEQRYMQKAAEGIAHAVVVYRHKQLLDGKILAVVGKGNNGGDAIAAALELQRQRIPVDLLITVPIEELSPLSKDYFTKFMKLKRGKAYLKKPLAKEMKEFDLIIDGLMGSGAKGPPKDTTWIDWMNQCSQKVVSIDMPSGLNASSTQSVFADVTVALECFKDVQFTAEGFERCGKIELAPFGLPLSFKHQLKPTAHFAHSSLITLPQPKKTQHKYERGYLLLYAGSKTTVGCRELAAHAALRAGSGMVRVLLQQDDDPSLHPIELVSSQLSDQEAVLKELKRAKALAMGPGIGKEKHVFDAICSLLHDSQLPVVLDADALYHFPNLPSSLIANRAILTPHEGELSYLFKKEDNLLEQCQQFAKKHQVILIKKGAPTWIFYPDAQPHVSTYGDPGMATAGSGDVLTGIIGSFLSQGVSLKESALYGVIVHGMCGMKAASTIGTSSLMAHDLIEALAGVRGRVS